MSFIYMDAASGKVLDIIQNRRSGSLKRYFNTFSKEIRNQVETITIDMYEPYIHLIKSCFHNAKIITDLFHIIQHWYLILKDNLKLNSTDFGFHTCYRHTISEAMIVDDLG